MGSGESSSSVVWGKAPGAESFDAFLCCPVWGPYSLGARGPGLLNRVNPQFLHLSLNVSCINYFTYTQTGVHVLDAVSAIMDSALVSCSENLLYHAIIM